MRSHEGYNILLNNGRSAGQFIFHTYFHIIPRKTNDNIKIEIWKRGKYTKDEFIKLNNQFKKDIDIIKKEE